MPPVQYNSWHHTLEPLTRSSRRANPTGSSCRQSSRSLSLSQFLSLSISFSLPVSHSLTEILSTLIPSLSLCLCLFISLSLSPTLSLRTVWRALDSRRRWNARRCPQPYALHPTPFTPHPTPYTPHPTPQNLHHTPHTLHTKHASSKPETRSPKAAGKETEDVSTASFSFSPSPLHPTPYTRNHSA